MKRIFQHKLYLPIILIMITSELVNMYAFNRTAFGWSFDDNKAWAIVITIAALKSVMIAVFFDGMARHVVGKGDWKYLILAPFLCMYLVFDGATSNEVVENNKAANISALTVSVHPDSTEFLMYRSEVAMWQKKQVDTNWSFQTRIDSATARMDRARLAMNEQAELKRMALIAGFESNKGNNFWFSMIGYYVAFGSFVIGLVFLVYQIYAGVHETPIDKYEKVLSEMVEAIKGGNDLPYSYDAHAKVGARSRSAFYRDVQNRLKLDETESKQSEMVLKRNEMK